MTSTVELVYGTRQRIAGLLIAYPGKTCRFDVSAPPDIQIKDCSLLIQSNAQPAALSGFHMIRGRAFNAKAGLRVDYDGLRGKNQFDLAIADCTHLESNQPDKAIADFDAVLRLNPKVVDSRYGRGLALIKTTSIAATPTLRAPRQSTRMSAGNSNVTHPLIAAPSWGSLTQRQTSRLGLSTRRSRGGGVAPQWENRRPRPKVRRDPRAQARHRWILGALSSGSKGNASDGKVAGIHPACGQGAQVRAAGCRASGRVLPCLGSRPALLARSDARLAARARPVARQPGNRTKLLVCRGARQPFNRAIECDDPLADRGYDGSTAMVAACCSSDCRFTQCLIDLLDQEPGPAIGHSELPRRRGDRSFGSDGFEQSDLAGADAVTAGEVETDGKVRVCHDSGSLSIRI
jgi:hypothetical protein